MHYYRQQSKKDDDKGKINQFDFPELLKHFLTIQEQHRKEKLASRTVMLLEKGVKNI